MFVQSPPKQIIHLSNTIYERIYQYGANAINHIVWVAGYYTDGNGHVMHVKPTKVSIQMIKPKGQSIDDAKSLLNTISNEAFDEDKQHQHMLYIESMIRFALFSPFKSGTSDFVAQSRWLKPYTFNRRTLPFDIHQTVHVFASESDAIKYYIQRIDVVSDTIANNVTTLMQKQVTLNNTKKALQQKLALNEMSKPETTLKQHVIQENTAMMLHYYVQNQQYAVPVIVEESATIKNTKITSTSTINVRIIHAKPIAPPPVQFNTAKIDDMLKPDEHMTARIDRQYNAETGTCKAHIYELKPISKDTGSHILNDLLNALTVPDNTLFPAKLSDIQALSNTINQ